MNRQRTADESDHPATTFESLGNAHDILGGRDTGERELAHDLCEQQIALLSAEDARQFRANSLGVK
jgi:hypothetical protein